MKCQPASVRRFSLAILVLFALIGFSSQAMASGDGGCSARWRLLHHDYEGCSNMVFLSPSNDTRVNLLLLMADLRSSKPGFGAGKNTKVRPEAPLFVWETLAARLGSQSDSAMLVNNDAAAQSGHAPCGNALPADDPFVLAVQGDRELKLEERATLLGARKKIQSDCAGDGAANVINDAEKMAKSAPAKAYARYIEGAAAFWQSDWEKAAAIFSSLMNAQPTWVRETATYMVGRALIKRAQVGAFDEYGSFAKDWRADAATVSAAESALDKYLQQYPKGAYTQSARGLKRRGYWLSQDMGKLEEEYGALLLMSPEERNVSDVELAQEIDNKLTTIPGTDGADLDSATNAALLKASRNPLLLAMLDLMAMRTSEAGDAASSLDRKPAAALSMAVLEKQKPYFAGQMPLYEYLLAVHTFYVENKPADVLRIIPDAARQGSFSYLQFSRQVLRGMALETMKDRNALAFWSQMLPGAKAPYERAALELAIAYHDERVGEIASVFAPASPVHYPYLREVLLARVADANLLRVQATNTNAPRREREVALFTLLYKEATRGHAESFLKDLALVPANAPTDGYFGLSGDTDSFFSQDENPPPPEIPLGIFLHDKPEGPFGCPGLRASETQLVKDASNPTARLCVADFVRLHPSISFPVSTASADDLGDTPSLFPGGEFVRMETYTGVLADAKSSKNDKAYALYRAVNCYAPSGNNDCGGKDVPKAQRKAWFTTLKRDYAGTRWANSLEYYW